MRSLFPSKSVTPTAAHRVEVDRVVARNFKKSGKAVYAPLTDAEWATITADGFDAMKASKRLQMAFVRLHQAKMRGVGIFAK